MSIDAHAHTNLLKGGRVRQGALDTGTTSLAGSLPAMQFSGPPFFVFTPTPVSIALTKDCFFPMIHSTGNAFVHIKGHQTDGNDPDNPRLGMLNLDTASAYTYDVDYRYFTI